MRDSSNAPPGVSCAQRASPSSVYVRVTVSALCGMASPAISGHSMKLAPSSAGIYSSSPIS